MRLVALVSGGKDSVFNMLQCIAANHEIVAVANIEPETKDELDSYMYQTVGHEIVSLIAVALTLPIYRQKTKGNALCKSKTYTKTSQDEVEDLFQLLQRIKNEIAVEGVSVGAIASDYQRTRVENVCGRLNLKCFAYLWGRNELELLEEMIEADLDAVIIKVSSIGLNPDSHLGMHIKEIKNHLVDINKKYGVNICGEGGEYETLTIDCPLFHRQIKIIESNISVLSNHAFAPVGFLNIKKAELSSKVWESDDPVGSLQNRLSYVKSVVKSPYNYIEDCVDEVSLNIFPQQKVVLPEILPFPFDSKESDDSVPISEYWKKTQASLYQPHSSNKASTALASVTSIDKTTCDLNYSSGWCSIGNVSGKSFSEAFRCLQLQLDRIRYQCQDLVFVNVFLRDMSEFHSMNKAYCQQMPEIMPPARVCVATNLPPEVNILLTVVAHKFLSKSQKALSNCLAPLREVVHVQSISHWAPANIGRYSQCVKIAGLYYLAGQIPLIPGTMELLNKPIYLQCRLALRHVNRILQSLKEELNFSNTLLAICYVTSEEIAKDIPCLWSYITNNNTAPVAVIVITGLPKNAQLEWEIVACEFENPQVYESAKAIKHFSVRTRRCVYWNPYCSSFVCRVYSEKADSSENPIEFTPEALELILKHCLDFVKNEVKNIGMHLCTLKLFYKSKSLKLGSVISECLLSFSFDHKVVVSGIPVVACGQDPKLLVTITGLCY